MDLETLRVRIYHCFATAGHAPEIDVLAGDLASTPEEVRDGLRRLAHARHVALDADDHVVMAHPFASVPLGFSVMGASTLWWGGCAWDSFALPHLLPDQAPVLVATRCPGCERPLAWSVGNQAPPAGEEVAHFLVPAAHIWDDVVHACGHQRLFCSTDCVETWLARTDNQRGYVMDLATLWRLASQWYAGRLEHGYTRRDPSRATDYLRWAGLSGPFWGL